MDKIICTVSPQTVSTSQFNILCHYAYWCFLQPVHSLSVLCNVLLCATMCTTVFYSLLTVCQQFTMYSSVQLCILLSSKVCQYHEMYCTMSQYLLLSSRFCPLSVSTTLCTLPWHNVYCCLLESVHCLSVECVWNVVAHSCARKGDLRGNRRMVWVAS
jgi:hypothetical protein